MKRKQTKHANVEELTSTEMLEGALLFLGESSFREQAVYQAFHNLADKNPQLRTRFRLSGSKQRLRSEPLRRILNFLEMGKIVEIAPPNPVNQYYRPRQTQMESVKRDLRDRGVLPKFEEFFKNLAEELQRLRTPTAQRNA